jgi:transposase-like protein
MRCGGDKYPHVVKSWRNNWEGLTVFFEYPKDIRKAIYTTNAIESLNSVIRTVVNKRKVFPSDQAALKVVYLATQQASKKWSMPIRNWTSALNRFMIMFDDRISKHLI